MPMPLAWGSVPSSMRLELTARHISITPSNRKIIEQRLTYLARMLNDSIVSVQVVVTKEKFRYHVDVTLHARGEHFLHGAATGRDVRTALAGAVEKIEHQAQKLKGKWSERKRRGLSIAKAASAAPRPERAAEKAGAARREAVRDEAGASSEQRIIRTRRYMVKPMAVEEAALRVGPAEHAFVVFWNAETDAFSVLFRRSDGNLGLIEPEA
jgi:putative sigma-54 modulation protein